MSAEKIEKQRQRDKARIRGWHRDIPRFDVPEPTKEERKKWRTATVMATQAVLSNEVATKNIFKTAMRLSFPSNKEPDKFPKGKVVATYDGVKVFEYNAEYILIWLYRMKYINYTPASLYDITEGSRQHFAAMRSSLEKVTSLGRFLTIENRRLIDE